MSDAFTVPELPDVTVYVERLAARCVGQTLERVRVVGISLLRSVDPPLSAAEGRRVLGVRRLGKRIVFELEGDLFLIFHLMIAGRFRWRERGAKASRKNGLATLDFPTGTLILTEASTQKRASLHLVRSAAALAEHDPGGLEVLSASLEEFRTRLVAENRTLKRALTDPHIFSGIGNAYSDEILHRARLSPVTLTSRLSDEECLRLYEATRETLELWIARLRDQVGEGFPEKVTAFRPEMAVHGRYRQPCPDCGAPVQRIVYAANETNYCARCQTGGKLLADRALSQLLKKDWPKSLDELEARRAR
jgi:formamidopyrimidine-DNA glycosylase